MGKAADEVGSQHQPIYNKIVKIIPSLFISSKNVYYCQCYRSKQMADDVGCEACEIK